MRVSPEQTPKGASDGLVASPQFGGKFLVCLESFVADFKGSPRPTSDDSGEKEGNGFPPSFIRKALLQLLDSLSGEPQNGQLESEIDSPEGHAVGQISSDVLDEVFLLENPFEIRLEFSQKERRMIDGPENLVGLERSADKSLGHSSDRSSDASSCKSPPPLLIWDVDPPICVVSIVIHLMSSLGRGNLRVHDYIYNLNEVTLNLSQRK